MTQQFSGIFKPTKWNEATYQAIEGGGKLTRVDMIAEFVGPLTGVLESQMLLAYNPDGKGSGVSLERVVGTLDGRQGSFILQGNGTFEGQAAETRWTILAGSGTDGFVGIRGGGGFPMQASPDGVHFTLDYDFEA